MSAEESFPALDLEFCNHEHVVGSLSSSLSALENSTDNIYAVGSIELCLKFGSI